MAQVIILCIIGLVLWVWLVGYLNATFFVADFREQESFSFLEANGCDFVEAKRIGNTPNINTKNERLTFSKVFSLTSEHTLIGRSKINNELKLFRVIIIKQWIPFNPKRELNIIEETDLELLNETRIN